MSDLVPQPVEVRLGKADLKTSDKLAIPGTLDVLQNVEQIETGKWQRRPGTALFDTLVGATRIHAGERELMMGTENALYSDIGGTFLNRGSIAGYKGDFDPVCNSPITQLQHRHVRAGGYDWHVWAKAGTTGGIFYAVRDINNGAYIVAEGTIQASSGGNEYGRPNILAVGTDIFITYVNDNGGNRTIVSRKIAQATPTAVGSAFSVEAGTVFNANVWGSYDIAHVSGTTVLFAYPIHSGSNTREVRFREWNVSTMGLIATLDSTGGDATATAAGGHVVSIFSVSGSYAVIHARAENAGSQHQARLDVHTAAIGLSGSQTRTNIYLDTGTTFPDFYNATGWIDGSGTWHIVAELVKTLSTVPTGSPRSQLWYWTRTSGGALSGPSVLYGLRLLSKRFTYATKEMCLVAGQSSTVAGSIATLFLLDIVTGGYLGRVLPSRSLPNTEHRGNLPYVTVDGTTVRAAQAYVATTAEDSSCMVTFVPQDKARWLEVAGVTLIPGSTISIYDGIGVSELGFHFPPGDLSVAHVAGTGLANGDYYYRASWAWVDTQGRLNESEPCNAVKLTVSGAPRAGQVTISTILLTMKRAPVPGAALKLYRSILNPPAGGAAEMFLVTTVPNDASADTIVVTDTTTDAILQTRERLYTLGNAVQSNTSPPPANMLAAWGERVWAAERDVVHFSKRIQDGFAVHWNDENFVGPIADGLGDVTAIAGNGSRFAIFKARAIYTISGDGPSDTGQGGFSDLKRVQAPLGARRSTGVLETEMGVFFQDDASGEIWLLPVNSDVPEPIGRDIESLAKTLDIIDAVVWPARHQVLLFSTQGTTLVYDLTHKQWSWNTGQPAVAAVVDNDGVYGYVVPTTGGGTDGDVRRVDETRWVEGYNASPAEGETYQAAWELTWLALNMVGGYKRLFAVVATGDKKGAHTLTCKLTYRFGNVVQTRTLASSAVVDDSGYRVEARPKIQHQQTSGVKIRYEDDSPLTAGAALEALLLLVGLRPARERLPKASVMT